MLVKIKECSYADVIDSNTVHECFRENCYALNDFSGWLSNTSGFYCGVIKKVLNDIIRLYHPKFLEFKQMNWGKSPWNYVINGKVLYREVPRGLEIELEERFVRCTIYNLETRKEYRKLIWEIADDGTVQKWSGVC